MIEKLYLFFVIISFSDFKSIYDRFISKNNISFNNFFADLQKPSPKFSFLLSLLNYSELVLIPDKYRMDFLLEAKPYQKDGPHRN